MYFQEDIQIYMYKQLERSVYYYVSERYALKIALSKRVPILTIHLGGNGKQPIRRRPPQLLEGWKE